jgi:hypothetical protein
MSAAATQVPSQRLFNLRVRRLGVIVEQGFGGHDHTADTVAALDGLLVDEGLLNLVHLLGVAQAFDCRDRFILRRADRSDAGTNRVAVHDYSASAALSQSAAELGTVQLQVVAQSVEQRHLRLDVDGLRPAVNAQLYFGHETSLGEGTRLNDENRSYDLLRKRILRKSR